MDDRGDGGGGNATSVEGEPSPGTANVSMVDTISEMTDDGKARDRNNATTVGDKPAGSPLLDPQQTPNIAEEFVDVQDRALACHSLRSSDRVIPMADSHLLVLASVPREIKDLRRTPFGFLFLLLARFYAIVYICCAQVESTSRSMRFHVILSDSTSGRASFRRSTSPGLYMKGRRWAPTFFVRCTIE